MLRVSALVLPAAYCALVLILAPPDRLGPPAVLDRTVVPGFSTNRLLYDDYDVTAMALRGLNTAVGRNPARREMPECLGEEFRPDSSDPRALSPSFFAEYPHAALWLFRLAFPSGEAIRSWGLSGGVLDACFPDLVTYTPATPNEQYTWQQLRRATNAYRVASTVCLMLMVLVLQFGFVARNRLQGATALLILPAALYFAVNRFDVLPALLTAVSLTCLARQWCGLSGIALGLATAVKVYPILLAPFIVRWLWRAPKRVARWVGGFAGALMAIVGCAWIVYGNEGLVSPYAYQVQRAPELIWIYYGHILPYSWALDPIRAGVFRIGSLAAIITVLLLPSMRELDQLLRRGLIVLITFTSLQVFWSPQWLLWLHPLLIPLVPGQAILGWLLAALDVTLFLSFPLVYDAGGLPARDEWIHALVWVRAACSVALLCVLCYREIQTTFVEWFARRSASNRP